MEKIRIEVDKVILYYMDRVDPDGNPYRFYVYKGMASEIEYFCLWRMKPGMHAMITNEYGVLDIIKEKFDNINIVEYSGIWI